MLRLVLNVPDLVQYNNDWKIHRFNYLKFVLLVNRSLGVNGSRHFPSVAITFVPSAR